MKYWTDTTYTDDRGASVVKRTMLNDEHETTLYLGKGMIPIPSPMGMMPYEFEVELDDIEDVEDAFNNFEEQMEVKGKAKAEEIQKELQSQAQAQQSKIVTSNGSVDPNSMFAM